MFVRELAQLESARLNSNLKYSWRGYEDRYDEESGLQRPMRNGWPATYARWTGNLFPPKPTPYVLRNYGHCATT